MTIDPFAVIDMMSRDARGDAEEAQEAKSSKVRLEEEKEEDSMAQGVVLPPAPSGTTSQP